MTLSQEEIATITRDVLQQYAQPLELVGLMASEGGSGRVELMITIAGCHDAPCRLLLNLSRASKAELENELRDTLQEQLRAHQPQPH